MNAQKLMLNPYLNPFEIGKDETNDILFVNDHQRIAEQLEGMRRMGEWFHVSDHDFLLSSMELFRLNHPECFRRKENKQKVLNRDDIVKMGEGAERFLAKYPYSAVAEKEQHKMSAIIGKLAEGGYIDFVKPVSEEEIKKMADEIEVEVKNRRKSGDY